MQAKKGYDKLGSKYNKILSNFHNKYIELPAVRKILKNIKGKQVLDVGCATGTHTALLVKKGAEVTGVDASKAMVTLAKQNLSGIRIHHADMSRLPFKDASFDVLFYGLCLHYVKNLRKVFREARRVLKPSGRIIFSTYNPAGNGLRKVKIHNKVHLIMADYFHHKEDSISLGLPNTKITTYPKTIAELFNPLADNSFFIQHIIEPVPEKSSRKHDPRKYSITTKIPSFIVVEARKI